MPFSDSDLIAVLHATATAIHAELGDLQDWGLAGTKDGQYVHDLAADRAGLKVLAAAGLDVLSEESAASGNGRELVVVMDPVDGSTNASRGIPWFNTSLCALDADGPRAALVVDLVSGARYEAVRGGGASRNGLPISPSGCTTAREAVVGLNGYPREHLGWKQYRALGAAALDLCAVASGILDAYVDCTRTGLGPWDYLGGLLICLEAGACAASVDGADLVARGHLDRRIPVAAATPELLAELLETRRRTGQGVEA